MTSHIHQQKHTIYIQSQIIHINQLERKKVREQTGQVATDESLNRLVKCYSCVTEQTGQVLQLCR